MLRKTCHFYGTISRHMAIPRFVTDRSDFVLCCVLNIQSNKEKTCCVPNTQSCTCTNKWDLLFCHLFFTHLPLNNVSETIHTISIGLPRHFWALLSHSLSVLQVSDSARCDEEGSVDTQQRACLLPRKKTHTPISFKLYMSAAENVLWL